MANSTGQRLTGSRQRVPLTITVLTGLCLAGCSNLSTQRFDSKKTTPTKDIGGVPFTLNKPQFTILHTPPAPGAEDTYQIRVDYVPDPTQTYMVKLDPNFNVAVDWTVTLDDGGSLSDSNAKMTDQSVAILSSVAKLAVAAFALDKYDESETTQLGKIDSTLTSNFGDQSPQLFDRSTSGLRKISSALANRALARWRELHKQFEPLTQENRLASFTYRDEFDRQILETALYLQSPVDSKEVNKVAEGTDSYPLAQQIKHAMSRLDRRMLLNMKADLLKEKGAIYAHINAVPTADPSPPELAENQANYGLVTDALKAINTPPRGLLFDLIDLSMTEWQRRILSDLNKEIDLRRLALRTGGLANTEDIETRDEALHKLLLRKAVVLGRGPDFRELTALRTLTSADPEKYAKARTSIAALEKALANAESSLTPAAPAAKPDDPVITPLVLNPECKPVNDDSLRAAMKMQGIPGHPPYIVVMQPAGTRVSELNDANNPCDSVPTPNPQPSRAAPTAPAPEVPKS